MSTYIPPHLRFTGPSMDIRNEARSLQSLAGNSRYADEPSYTDRDILAHFWAGGDNDAKAPPSCNTLNASKANPDQLAFLMVYAAGHPKWEEQSIGYVKSALHLLPGVNEKLAEHRAVSKLQAAGDAAKFEEENDTGEAAVVDVERSAVDAPKSLEVAMADHKIVDHDVDGADGKVEEQKGAAADEAVAGTGTATSADETVGAKQSQRTGIADETGANKHKAVQITETQETRTTGGVESEGHERQNVNSIGKKRNGQSLLQQIPPIDYVPPTHPPIAVFKTNGHSHHGFKFVGWHKIERTAILMRKSNALGDLMSRKWEEAPDRRIRGAARPKQSWFSDLGREWAVIKLVKLDATSQDCPPIPTISKIQAWRNRKHVPIDGGPTDEGSPLGGVDGQVGAPEAVVETPESEVKTDGVKTDGVKTDGVKTDED